MRKKFAVLFVSLVLITGFCSCDLIKTTKSGIVPEVVGLNLPDARAALSEKGFECSVITDYSDTFGKNFVMKQSHAADTAASLGTSVILTVSLGSKKDAAKIVSVPDVLNKTESEAKATLEGVGLECKVVYSYDASLALETVTHQGTPAEQKVNSGSTVMITVNRKTFEMDIPDFTLKTLEKAIEAAINSKLLLDVEYTNDLTSYLEKLPSPMIEGIVYVQNIDPGVQQVGDNIVTVMVYSTDDSLITMEAQRYPQSLLTTPLTMYCTAVSGLNIRTLPEDKAAVIGEVPTHETVTLVALNDEWGYIRYLDKTGFVRSKYLSKKKPAAPAESGR